MPTYRFILGAALAIAAFAFALLASMALDCHLHSGSCTGSPFHPVVFVIFGVGGIFVLLAALATQRAIRGAPWYRPWHRFLLYAAVAVLLPKIYFALTGSAVSLHDSIDLPLAAAGLVMAVVFFGISGQPAAESRTRIDDIAISDQFRYREYSAGIAIAIALVMLPSLVDGFFRQDLYELSPAAYWTFDFARFVVLPLGAAIWLAAACGVRPRSYGMRRIAEGGTVAQFVGLAVFLVVILDAVYFSTMFAAKVALQSDRATDFYQSINPTGLLRIPATIYMSATAALVEEVFCRGLPLLYLERRFPQRVPTVMYVVGTAALFGAIHWENGAPAALASFAFGLVAAAVYLRLRDLWPLIAAHFIIDMIWLS